MRKLARILGQLFIGVFFFWHAAAIGIYAIPMDTKDPLVQSLRRNAFPVISPYVLGLSQWQQWNLFSPDPLRRVTRYRVERQLGDGSWQVLEWMTPGHYGILRHANRFKMLIGLLESDQGTYNTALVHNFLLGYCAPNGLPKGAPVRVAYVYYIVDRPSSFLAAMHPSPWPPNFFENHSDSVTCP